MRSRYSNQSAARIFDSIVAISTITLAGLFIFAAVLPPVISALVA